jgi:hypothetical protein
MRANLVWLGLCRHRHDYIRWRTITPARRRSSTPRRGAECAAALLEDRAPKARPARQYDIHVLRRHGIDVQGATRTTRFAGASCSTP